MLGGAFNIRMIAEAGDGAEALDQIQREASQVILMDIRMPIMGGGLFGGDSRSHSSAPGKQAVRIADHSVWMDETASADPAESAFLVGMSLLRGQVSAAPDDQIESAKGAFISAIH
jgi:CheY-like chemotaxis protein